jgi:hypothetical protein
MSLVEAESDQKPLRNAKGQIVAGAKLNGAGRPKGCRNKLAEVFIGDLYEKWQLHGESVIDRVIAERPDQFLKVVAQLMPKDVNLTVRQLDELSDEQLLMRLRQVTEMARPLLIDARAIESPVGAIEDVPVVIEPAKR